MYEYVYIFKFNLHINVHFIERHCGIFKLYLTHA